MIIVLEPIISKAVNNHIGNAFIDENKMITDILSMDGKVTLSSSRNSIVSLRYFSLSLELICFISSFKTPIFPFVISSFLP